MAEVENPEIIAANKDIRDGVLEQISELRPSWIERSGVDTIMEELDNLDVLIGGKANDPVSDILTDIIAAVTDIQDGKESKQHLAIVMGDLESLKHLISEDYPVKAVNLLAAIISRVLQLLNHRPDVMAIMGDLEAIKNLKGGPADATAFHDFHVLQMAFKNVWMQAVDENLRVKAGELYEETVRLYSDAGVPAPAFDAVNDIEQLKGFLRTVEDMFKKREPQAKSPFSFGGINFPGLRIGNQSQGVTVAAPTDLRAPQSVITAYPEANIFWRDLDMVQQSAVQQQSDIVNDPDSSATEKKDARDKITAIAKSAFSKTGRIFSLLLELGRAINEPYAFDVFAPDSYNYGIMLTYRQKWEPLQYQAGDLAATIPLAPGESRKYSKKRVVKKTRAEKEIEKAMSTKSLQSSDISRAESEIMNKTNTATNFKMTSSGSFNIGIGSINASSEFALNQAQESAKNKKEFHEATLKATEEYRQERSLEIDTTNSIDFEETNSGEISNPNNEITVTYLFYELQRRYKISEFIYRARPVILIAQDVPAPHEIDEAWLIQYQWIISRVLLDDSFRPAMEYLTSGLAGDEVSLQVIKAHWTAQYELTKSLESQVNAQLMMRDSLRETLVQTALQKSLVEAAEMPMAVKVLSLGMAVDPSEKAAEQLEASRRAAETRLKYVEEALADSQNKLKQATDTYEKATQQYSAALQQQYSRHVAIDQLRVHVKQNILYYMQAIWSHEPPDQRFFRLYNKKVACTRPVNNCVPAAQPSKSDRMAVRTPASKGKFIGADQAAVKFSIDIKLCLPTLGAEVDLIEMADIDNPLGYKGNYIIFPMKQHCYLTDFMLHEFVDEYFGIRDPDPFGDMTIEDLGKEVNRVVNDPNSSKQEQDQMKEIFLKYLTVARRSSDEIIVPTGQLFIEALPGSHPLLEDFKLLHRAHDVRKVKAEVRKAELENLRLAARVVAGRLEDPDIEKKIIVGTKGNGINVDTN